MLIKVGTLDDPSVFVGPQLVTWTSECRVSSSAVRCARISGITFKANSAVDRTVGRHGFRQSDRYSITQLLSTTGLLVRMGPARKTHLFLVAEFPHSLVSRLRQM